MDHSYFSNMMPEFEHLVTPGTHLWNSSSTEDAKWSLAAVEADEWRNGQWNDILATGWMWELESERSTNVRTTWKENWRVFMSSMSRPSTSLAVSNWSETPTVGEFAQPLRCFIWNHPDHHDDGYWADRPLAMKFSPSWPFIANRCWYVHCTGQDWADCITFSTE